MQGRWVTCCHWAQHAQSLWSSLPLWRDPIYIVRRPSVRVNITSYASSLQLLTLGSSPWMYTLCPTWSAAVTCGSPGLLEIFHPSGPGKNILNGNHVSLTVSPVRAPPDSSALFSCLLSSLVPSFFNFANIQGALEKSRSGCPTPQEPVQVGGPFQVVQKEPYTSCYRFHGRSVRCPRHHSWLWVLTYTALDLSGAV